MLFLEGQIVHLPHPTNQFTTDILIDRTNAISIQQARHLSTSLENSMYAMRGDQAL